MSCIFIAIVGLLRPIEAQSWSDSFRQGKWSSKSNIKLKEDSKSEYVGAFYIMKTFVVRLRCLWELLFEVDDDSNVVKINSGIAVILR